MEEEAVADASVVVKWFLEEGYSEQARKLRDCFVTGKISLSVPSLLFYEVLNALWDSGQFRAEELALAARSLHKYGLKTWEPKGEVIERTAAMAQGKDVSVYDAAYVALAVHIDAKLYTADAELVRKFPDTARHIREYDADSGSR